MLAIGERVTFRHPLVRSAVYRSAAVRGAPGGPPGVGGGDRSRGRPGPSCVASGCGGGGARRAGRPGARALGRAGAGARRARRRGGVPAARGRADGGPGAAGRARAGRGAGEPAGRRVRRGARAAGHSGGRAARRAPACPGGAAARRGRLRLEPRQRRSAAAASRPRRRLETFDPRARARDVSRRLGRGAVRRASRERRRPARGLAAPCRTAPAAGAPSASVRSAAGRLRAGVHRGTRRRGAGVAGAQRPRSPVPRSPWRRCSGGAGWHTAAAVSCGTTTPVSRSATREVAARARRRGTRGLPSLSTCWARPSPWAATSRGPRC